MEVSFADRGNAVVLTITGSVDGLCADQLGEAFAGPIAQGRARLVADFARVNYTSTAGLRALLGALKESRRQGGDLRLAALQPQVERVLALAGFTGIVQVFADVDAAVASYAA